MSSRKAEMVLELIDRSTRPLQRLLGLMGRLGSASQSSNQKSARASALAERATKAYASALGGVKSAQAGLDRAIDRTTAKLKKQATTMRDGTRMMGQGIRGIGETATTAAAVAAAYGASAIAAAGLITGPAAQFEKFAIQLETLEGSSEKGKKAMAWIEDFATRTPMELDQVVQAYAKMRAFGLDPTNGSMLALMDTASAMGGGAEMIESMTLALGKAQTKGKLQGEEIAMLMERGIPVYDLLGKKMGKNASQIMAMATAGKLGRKEIQLLIEAMGEKNAGSSEKISKTWDGIVSNIMDWSGKFRRMVANAGVFDFLKARLQGVLDTLQKMSDSGELQAWADTVAQHILNVLTGMWELGKWVAATWQRLSPYVDMAAKAIGGYQNVLLAVMAIPFRGTIMRLVFALGQLAVGAAMTGWSITGMGWSGASLGAMKFARGLLGILNPLKLVRGAALAMRVALIASGIGAIALGIAAAGLWIYNNWSGLGAFFSEIGAAIMEALGPFAPIVEAIGAAFSNLFGWVTNLLGPVDASGASWKRWGKAVGNVIGGAIRWVGKFAGWVASLFGGLPSVNWSELIPSFSWDGVLKVLNWLSYLLPIRWLEFIPGFSWDAVLTKITSWGEWVMSLDWAALVSVLSWDNFIGGITSWAKWVPNLDWGSVISVFTWDNVLKVLDWLSYLSPMRWLEFIPNFSWSAVLSKLGAWASWITTLSWSNFIPSMDWLPAINLDGLASAWTGMTNWIGEKAAGLWDSLPDIEWKFWDDGQINDPQTLLAAAKAADRLASEFPQISAAANKALEVSQIVLRGISTAIASMTLDSEGARLIKSLADGMLSQLPSILAASAQIGAAIRTSLPASAQASITMSGGTKLDGARATGGPVWSGGRFMVGERGPELFMPKSDGWIVPNHALSAGPKMPAMPAAPRAPQRSFAVGRSPATYAVGGGGGSSISVNAPVSLTITGNADSSTVADLRKMMAERDRALMEKLERAQRDKKRLSHGGQR